MAPMPARFGGNRLTQRARCSAFWVMVIRTAALPDYRRDAELYDPELGVGPASRDLKERTDGAGTTGAPGSEQAEVAV